jgi:hypothetical protein
MMNKGTFFVVCASSAVGTLLLAYGIAQIWLGVAVVFVVGLLGGIAWFNKQKGLSNWMINLFWLGIIFSVTLGVFLDLNTTFLIAAVVSGLGAWDMIRFQKNLERYSPSEKILQLEKQHFIVLVITLLAGGILAFAVANIRIQISFYPALGLGVILILVLSLIIRYFLRRVGKFD